MRRQLAREQFACGLSSERANEHAKRFIAMILVGVHSAFGGHHVERVDADVAWDATARYRFRAVLVMAFAALALVLAMVGVFGVLAYSVERRVRDFGVRRALGATTGDVVRLVVGSAVRVIATGAVIGLALSMALGRVMTPCCSAWSRWTR